MGSIEDWEMLRVAANDPLEKDDILGLYIMKIPPAADRYLFMHDSRMRKREIAITPSPSSFPQYSCLWSPTTRTEKSPCRHCKHKVTGASLALSEAVG